MLGDWWFEEGDLKNLLGETGMELVRGMPLLDEDLDSKFGFLGDFPCAPLIPSPGLLDMERDATKDLTPLVVLVIDEDLLSLTYESTREIKDCLEEN